MLSWETFRTPVQLRSPPPRVRSANKFARLHYQRGEGLIRVRATALLVALLIAGCSRHATLPTPHEITIYYCKAGSNDLVRVPFTVDPKLSGTMLASYAVNQLIAGPPEGGDAVVLFPHVTFATVSLQGTTAVVNLTGAIERFFQRGGGDEVGIFKSLTYTLTALPGVNRVQVLVGGQTVAALPGGQFELDEPLTRAMFAQ